MAQQIPPPAKGMSPRDYYGFLTRQGVPGWAAYDSVRNYYGTPQQAQEQAAEDAQPGTGYQLGQVGGYVGGALIGREIVTGGENVRGLFNSENPSQGMTTNPSMATPKGVSATRTDASTANVGTNKPSNINAQPVTEIGSTTMPDGSPGKLMSDGGKVGNNGEIVNPDGTSGGSFQGQALAGLQVAGGAAQAYNGYKQYQSGEKLGGAANVAGGAYQTAAGVQTIANGGTAGTLGQYAPAVGTAVAAAQIGQQMLNDKGSSEDRAAKSQAEAQKAALLWIPGYGWIAYAALAGIDAVTGGKGTELFVKYNKFNNKITDRIDFGLGKNIRGKLFHQSTKGVQQMHSGQLMQNSNDPQWQNYVVAMRMQVEEGPKDKERPFAGKYKTFSEYKQAGLDANNLTGVYGNLDTFKPTYATKANVPDWSKLTFDQQKAVTQRLIDEDMYYSKKGEVLISDKEKARKIYEDMAKTNFEVTQSSAQPNKMGTYKPGQNIETLASAAGKPTPSTAIARQPLTTTRDEANRAVQAISGSPLTDPGFALNPNAMKPINKRPTNDPNYQWSKEAQQRELTRRLQRQRR
jgi:hypothetical protein